MYTEAKRKQDNRLRMTDDRDIGRSQRDEDEGDIHNKESGGNTESDSKC